MTATAKRKRIVRAGMAMVGLLAALGGGVSFAQTQATAPTAATADAKADALLQQAAARLTASAGLLADYETITEFATPYKDTRETGSVLLARPNRLRIETERFRRVRAGTPWEATGNGSTVVSDGTTATQLTRHPASAQYRQQPVAAAWLGRSLESLPPVQAFFDAATLPKSGHYAGQQTRDGETFDVVTVAAEGETRTLFLDAAGTIRIVEAVPQAGKGRGGLTKRTVRVSAWKPLPADAATRFAFTPPAEATEVGAGTRRADGLLAVGSPAPDFVAEDATGKPVHLSDFAGKVVVLKFWATWCWPCRQSFPQTRQLAQEYGNQDVVVLAVAMWDSQKAFRGWNAAYQKAHTADAAPALHLAYDPQPQGKDAASTLYGVSTTPTEFVIGRDGRVQAAFAGFNGPSDQTRVAVRSALGLPVASAGTTAAK